MRAIVLLSHARVLDDFGGKLLHFLLAIWLPNRRKCEDSCFQISDAMPEWPEIHICFAGSARQNWGLSRMCFHSLREKARPRFTVRIVWRAR